MEKISPDLEILRAWSSLPPLRGDLVFCASAGTERELVALGFPVFSPEELRVQALDLWSLNYRSWYTYALKRARSCAFLAAGELDELPTKLRANLLKEQVKVGSGAVLGGRWMSAAHWAGLSDSERVEHLRKWHRRNDAAGGYPVYRPAVLSAEARASLENSGLFYLLNRYAPRSGPNCFAAALEWASGGRRGWQQLWLHPEPFLRGLQAEGFKTTRGLARAGDVLVVRKQRKPVHAAVLVDSEWIFEKPGQDFYEPYRLLPRKDFARDWPGARVEAYRR